jgi:DNA polymerase (family 10)
MAAARTNAELAAVFAEMADLSQIAGGNPHRIRAFRRTARVLEDLPESAASLLGRGALHKVPGLGEGSVVRIKQILRTGTCDEHRRLRSQLPVGLRDLLEVKGIGASTARRLWQHLKIASLEQLEWACRTGQLEKVPRMGQRTAEKLMRSIAEHRLRVGRLPYADSRRMGERLVAQLADNPAVQQLQLTGSVRRGKATIGDLDMLVASDDGLAITSHFVTLPEVESVLVQGDGRASVRLSTRQQCDVRVVAPECWGAGLHYFTGSKLHNIAVRARGLKVAGLKISDKGIFVRDTDQRVAPGTAEADIFAAARLPFIPPELRENTGEIEAAEQGRLPRLVDSGDLRGDLHCHTLASDGRGTAEEMARAAAALGHDYLAITDHTQALSVARGLDERRLVAQRRHLAELEDHLGLLRLAAGTEVDILADGSLDLDVDVLRGMDWVVASIHSHLDQPGSEITDRLVAAIRTGVVDCIGHPTGRRLDKRAGAELDLERLLDEARRYGVAIEVNGNPYRMDLPDIDARRAAQLGVPLAVNTDAHAPAHLSRQEYGLVTARRAWLEPRHVLNCQPWQVLADRRRDRLRSGSVAVGGIEAVPVDDFEEPARPLPSGHWPEQPVVGDGGEDVEPPVDDDDADLGDRLAARPLEPELRQRVDDWLRNGGDPALEEALGALGANPMQVAFGLLMEG